MSQLVLIVDTERADLRDPVLGTTWENSNLVRPGYIGNTPADPQSLSYDCVLRALADGWKLLAPPIRMTTCFAWWLVRDA